MRNTDKKKENKVLMSMRISAEDKELIEEKARKTGLTTSEYMRRCALGRKLPCYGDTSLLSEYSMQLGKIGSNLNQIAKHLNGGGDFYSVYYEVKEAIREVIDVGEKLAGIQYKMEIYDEFNEEYNYRKQYYGVEKDRILEKRMTEG